MEQGQQELEQLHSELEKKCDRQRHRAEAAEAAARRGCSARRRCAMAWRSS